MKKWRIEVLYLAVSDRHQIAKHCSYLGRFEAGIEDAIVRQAAQW